MARLGMETSDVMTNILENIIPSFQKIITSAHVCSEYNAI